MIGAIGTIVVCVLAIWGDRVKARFLHPTLRLVAPDTPPGKVSFDPPRYYFHLRLQNSGNATARNCRVLLYDMQDGVRGENRFVRHPVPIPLQFTWSPSEMPPLQRDVPSKAMETIDLGFVVGDSTHQAGTFQPAFYVTPRGHDYGLTAGGRARYFLGVVADDSVSPRSQVFEVSWDGRWDDDAEIMRKHLVVTELADAVRGDGPA